MDLMTEKLNPEVKDPRHETGKRESKMRSILQRIRSSISKWRVYIFVPLSLGFYFYSFNKYPLYVAPIFAIILFTAIFCLNRIARSGRVINYEWNHSVAEVTKFYAYGIVGFVIIEYFVLSNDYMNKSISEQGIFGKYALIYLRSSTSLTEEFGIPGGIAFILFFPRMLISVLLRIADVPVKVTPVATHNESLKQREASNDADGYPSGEKTKGSSDGTTLANVVETNASKPLAEDKIIELEGANNISCVGVVNDKKSALERIVARLDFWYVSWIIKWRTFQRFVRCPEKVVAFALMKVFLCLASVSIVTLVFGFIYHLPEINPPVCWYGGLWAHVTTTVLSYSAASFGSLIAALLLAYFLNDFDNVMRFSNESLLKFYSALAKVDLLRRKIGKTGTPAHPEEPRDSSQVTCKE